MSTTEIKMPQMGESIAEGTLTRWFKQPGDTIKRDEPLFEISTDKVDAEIPAPVRRRACKRSKSRRERRSRSTRSSRLLGDGSGGGGGGSSRTARCRSRARDSSHQPRLAKKEAHRGRARRQHRARGRHAPAPAPQCRAKRMGTASDLKKTRSSPLVRRIAREHGINDLSVIPGTGIDGRVTKDDILSYVENGGAAAAPAPAAPSAPRAATSGGGGPSRSGAQPIRYRNSDSLATTPPSSR